MLLAFGANTYGQLGIRREEKVYKPTLVELENFQPIYLSAGGRHTFILDEKGRLLTTGENKWKECLHEMKFTEKFIPVKRDYYWKMALAGWEFSILLKNNSIWTCGRGNYGELGLGYLIHQTELKLIPEFPPINKNILTLSVGLHHVICLLTNGECWGWGDARHGELGPGLTGIIYKPTRMNIPNQVRAIACGRGFSVTLSTSLNIWGRLRGITQNIKLSINPDEIQSLTASWSAVFLLTQHGKVITLGCNDLGQSCPPEMPPLKMLSAGSEHCLGLGIDGKVYGWGWNEHSNIREDNVNVQEVYSIKLPKGKVIFVAAGCGTSWIYLEPLEKDETKYTITDTKSAK
ncbi:hypothetical protein PCANB_000768 [Pneumocystis canis]|nr:hypothetical protein PCK1_000849 [Pneumocystis canis]KAG5437338.1 hypothetical protein PCANB_000768 [Pneumocystis canis]